jgi:transcription elongation factor GreA
MTMSKQAGAELGEEARHRLRTELDVLREQRKALGTGDDVQGLGDRADDADALNRLSEAAIMDERIGELTRLLAGASPTSGFTDEQNLLPDGSRVTLRHGDGSVQSLRAVALTEQVPPGEEDSSLTLDSPLGRALAGHAAGDTVCYETPDGARRAEIVDIKPPA